MIDVRRMGPWSQHHHQLHVERLIVPADVEDVYDTVEWERRSASIVNDKGDVIFQQDDIEVPTCWSQLALNVVASKYFYGKVGTPERETSVRQLIERVAHTVQNWGRNDGVFDNGGSAGLFGDELRYILLHQIASFNSPVWFNVGLYAEYGHHAPTVGPYRWADADNSGDVGRPGRAVPCEDAYEHPQCSACFIQHVDDTIEDIMRLATSEALLFKHGSGSGTDLSTIRSTRETLSGGGTPSGPLSFMKIYDRVAGVIKSGGKTRRAAKMQSLGVWHPDIMAFIGCKWHEEQKAHVLIDNGYDGSMDGDAYGSAHFQNANLSVRVTDDFMEAVSHKKQWDTVGVTDGIVKQTLPADDVWKEMAACAWHCGDPGIQYHSTINEWHTCKDSGEIHASNPCSEYMFIDDSACNLASINLVKMMTAEGGFDVQKFVHVVHMMTIAQDILVDNSSYPTEDICKHSHEFRPLGLGYANLGALLMRMGMPYDSSEGRALAGAITSLMTATAYRASQKMADVMGPFDRYDENKQSFHAVMLHHKSCALDNRDVCHNHGIPTVARTVADAAVSMWTVLVSKIEHVGAATSHGYRNAQVTVLAPTGTIGFMMDCDTTGVEPDIALVKYKALAGGGMMKITNKSVDVALKRLSYGPVVVKEILKYIHTNDTIEGCKLVGETDLDVFDCAFKPLNGTRSIHYHAHLKMMAAVQPFLSGAISKTVNMPEDCTPEEIAAVYMMGWKMGLKAVAVYRENSKRIQPLSVDKDKGEGRELKPGEPVSISNDDAATVLALALEYPNDYPRITQLLTDYTQSMIRQVQAEQREQLPTTRSSVTHKFEVQGHEGYVTVGMYDDGRPGELFITMNKEGSTVRGLMDGIGVASSMCLQYGVPLKVLATKFEHTRFEPAGFTKNQDIPMAKSLLDYIFRWLTMSFPDGCYIGYRPIEVCGMAVGNINDIKFAEIVLDDDQLAKVAVEAEHKLAGPELGVGEFHNQDDAPPCPDCGSITVRNGSCYRCYNCGSSLGCS